MRTSVSGPSKDRKEENHKLISSSEMCPFISTRHHEKSTQARDPEQTKPASQWMVTKDYVCPSKVSTEFLATSVVELGNGPLGCG